MRFEWRDESYGYHQCIMYDNDEKKLEEIHFRDYTLPEAVKKAEENYWRRPYAFEVGYCRGYSMDKGFDKCDDPYNTFGYHGTPTHTVEDIKKWCENYLAQLYLNSYYHSLETLNMKERRAKELESMGFVYEREEDK